MQSYNGGAYVCGMMPKNNFSDQPVFSVGLSPKTIQAACWQHYRRHWWRGLLLGLVAALPFLYNRLHYGMGFPPLRIADIGVLTNEVTIWAMAVVWFAGIPSAMGGLLRQPWLWWLCRYVRSRWQLVAGSVIGFEANVVLVVLWYWWGTSASNGPKPLQEMADIAGPCQLASLPWLVSTAWASWQLVADLRMLPREENSPVRI